MIFAYFGPETTLPVASVLAATVGFVLAAGRFSLAFLGRRLPFLHRNERTSSPETVGAASADTV